MLKDVEINPIWEEKKWWEHITTGMYYVCGFNFEVMFKEECERYPELLGINCYGICDNYEQLVNKLPKKILDEGRDFVISLTSICRKDQPSRDGFRFHKWGPYIGEQDIRSEYLYDNEHIDEVFVFHIYELKKK